MIGRILYHHYITRRNNDEILKKIYLKQKEEFLKGDWVQTLETNLATLKENFDDVQNNPNTQRRQRVRGTDAS